MASQLVRPRPRGQVLCRGLPARTRAHQLASLTSLGQAPADRKMAGGKMGSTIFPPAIFLSDCRLIRSQSAPLSGKFLPLNEKPLKRAFRQRIYCGDENINSRRRPHVKTSSAIYGYALYARRRGCRSPRPIMFIIHAGAAIGSRHRHQKCPHIRRLDRHSDRRSRVSWREPNGSDSRFGSRNLAGWTGAT